MAQAGRTCPICTTKEPVAKYQPFCSKRCADVDLHRWFGGAYSIPAAEPPDEFEVMEAMEAARRENQE